MIDRNKVWQWVEVEGDEVQIGRNTLIPISQVLIVRWPLGGFVWNVASHSTIQECLIDSTCEIGHMCIVLGRECQAFTKVK